jgi:hypothetical protein
MSLTLRYGSWPVGAKTAAQSGSGFGSRETETALARLRGMAKLPVVAAFVLLAVL